ncbi:hypothetical protein [Pseudomonas sp.]
MHTALPDKPAGRVLPGDLQRKLGVRRDSYMTNNQHKALNTWLGWRFELK